jgi:glycerol kinase
MLYDIREGYWSKTICRLLNIPTKMLPEVKNSADDYGKTHKDIFGTCIPIRGVAGDQQAAMIGQACFEPGMMKATYGTGCFALLNTGLTPVKSKSRLLTTIAYQFNGQPTYALEGSIFVAGAVVQWLRDSLKIIREALETEQLAMQADESQNITIVPAFVGLGAPHWNSECRGAVFGLTRSTGAPEMARAALESIGFQTRDLLEAMSTDWQSEGISPTLRVDGGMSSNDWAMKFLSDIIDAPVDRANITETTALGAAWLAGMQIGVYSGQVEFSSRWTKEKEFKPTMNDEKRQQKYLLWKKSVEASLSVPT